jgi:putative tryptophan/tyrosine transport system substrate-binding protein
VTRSRVRYVVAVSVAVLSGVVVLSRPVGAAQPDHKAVKLAFVDAGSPSTAPKGVPAFWDRLQELGYVEGQNLTVERRFADGHLERLPALMAEIVGQKIDVLVTYGTPAGLAAKHATSTIPIVVAAMGDPLGIGLVASLARPGGNLTGVSLDMTEDLTGKWLEIVQEVFPRVSTLAVLSNPDSPLVAKLTTRLRVAAAARGVALRFVEVRTPDALENAFKQAKREAQAMLVLPDPVTASNRKEITALAAKYRIPALYTIPDFMDSGGLIAYGVDSAVLFRRAADYVDKILKGAAPGDLPIEQPNQYVLEVNLKTARALGITIPQSILLRADEVIR